MQGYIALYLGNQYEIYANDVWSAKQKAVKDLQVPKKKEWQVSIHLAEVNNSDYKHTADF
jgi:hypothetical protein